ncbi:ATP-NAD kinase family protein [Halomarina oriensis]|uniref:ATP-NAD kinase n=1 Tax=Halomarina oriensis TaxID=671145 RepID=A0A6B0GHK2_9EURY|nr:ATP-NAD kinase family protein [Halomarina oriensis]MWG33407.1 ATP-NAD kinase [Halomarina oriensis]
MSETRIGLVVNPIAGMGGRVGLKGTDSRSVLERARELGAEPVSPDRTGEALDELAAQGVGVDLLVGPGPMGETVATSRGFEPTVVTSLEGDETTAADTRRVADALVDADVELLVFAGGDGTARDVADAVDQRVPVVGIPTGVKIYSGVFAPTPRAAGRLLAAFVRDEVTSVDLREVMDIDESAFREDRLSATLYGYLRVPRQRRLVQSPKSGGGTSDDAAKAAIAAAVVERMEPDRYYVVGPGTTTSAVMDRLDLPHSLLGVDVVRDGKLVGRDVNEADLLELLDGVDAEIVVGVIGGQGFVFGRGNQQLSGRVVERVGVENVTILATQEKLLSLDGPLYADTGDDDVDAELTGYVRVVTGRGRTMVVEMAG